jgi:hypothetical protein
VPLVPSWVLPVDAPTEEPPEKPEDPEDAEEDKKPAPGPALAPSKRFLAARLNLGKFADSGSKSSLASGLGHYVRSGLGGASTAAQRLAGTARVAGRLFGGLEGFRTGDAQPEEFGLDRASLSGKSAREVGDKIVDAICPVDGSQDTEARRDSLSRAISELTEQYPNVDLTALTPEQIDRLLEVFISYDISHRIELDVGKAIFDKAANYATAVKRIEEMRQYVREKISATFREKIKNGEKLTRKSGASLMGSVIRDTMSVFEDYLR